MQVLEKILERLGAYICDELCCHRYIGTDKGEYAMQEICEKCELGGYLDDIRKRLSCENSPEIMRLSRDNDGWIPMEEWLPEEGQEVWISVKTDCVRRGMYTKCFGFGMREGFICSDGFVDINAVNAWKLYIMPEPYCPKAKVPEKKQEWKERMLRNFLRGHECERREDV